jgi:hypothetical protein
VKGQKAEGERTAGRGREGSRQTARERQVGGKVTAGRGRECSRDGERTAGRGRESRQTAREQRVEATEKKIHINVTRMVSYAV